MQKSYACILIISFQSFRHNLVFQWLSYSTVSSSCEYIQLGVDLALVFTFCLERPFPTWLILCRSGGTLNPTHSLTHRNSPSSPCLLCLSPTKSVWLRVLTVVSCQLQFYMLSWWLTLDIVWWRYSCCEQLLRCSDSLFTGDVLGVRISQNFCLKLIIRLSQTNGDIGWLFVAGVVLYSSAEWPVCCCSLVRVGRYRLSATLDALLLCQCSCILMYSVESFRL